MYYILNLGMGTGPFKTNRFHVNFSFKNKKHLPFYNIRENCEWSGKKNVCDILLN